VNLICLIKGHDIKPIISGPFDFELPVCLAGKCSRCGESYDNRADFTEFAKRELGEE
jgi:hypothetical protein